MRRAGDFVVDADAVRPDGKVREQGALTRTEPPLRTAPVSSRTARPDPSFITHLIAMAEQAPQTRALRRAAVQDVQAAYRATASNMTAATPSAGRTQRSA